MESAIAAPSTIVVYMNRGLYSNPNLKLYEDFCGVYAVTADD